MKSNYDILGNYIRLVDVRNKEETTDRVVGININKCFMPSVANIIGTDLSNYKLITRGKFACNPMHVGRDEKLPIALYTDDKPSLVSPAYFMFEIKEKRFLNEEYLMMWFRRPEFDRVCWLKTDGSVRGGISWEDICRLEVPVLPMEKQLEIVGNYQVITDRIALKQRINDKKCCIDGDLLFCVRGSTTGRMNWANQTYAIGRGLAAIRHKTDRNLNWFIKAMIANNLQEILAAATGSTFPNIGKDLLNGFQVVIPDGNTLQKFSLQGHTISCLITENAKEIDALLILQKILLSKLTV